MKNILTKGRLIGLLSVLTGGIATALVLSTIAWFADMKYFSPTDLKGGTLSDYFDSGKGTSGDPFVITKPEHYYNLVYLQENNDIEYSNGVKFYEATLYFQFGKINCDGVSGTADDSVYTFYDYSNSGTLNTTTTTIDGETVTIPQTSTYLNMNYYQGTDPTPGSEKLLPLGSARHPFKGIINGHDLTVKNLYVDGNGLSDIGIFGFVGSTARIKNIYFDNVNIDAKQANAGSLTSVNHSPHTGAAYIGSIAGHVSNAKQSFSDVYINNVTIHNSTGGITDAKSNYGYFGHSDEPSETISDSSSYNVRVDPESAYNAINEAYTHNASKDLATRGTSYQGNETGTLATAVGSGNNSYTIGDNSTEHQPYSLSTIGYKTGGDSAMDYVRYVDTTNNNRLTRISAATTKLSKVPSDWSVYPDGNYIYYDDTNNHNCWRYSYVSSDTSGETQYVEFNCFTISYEYNSTTYYWYYNNGVLGATTTAPSSNPSNLNDYYFVFQQSAGGGAGVTTFTEFGNATSYCIYSPANKKWVVAISSSNNAEYFDCTFSENADVATSFLVAGPETTLTYKYNSKDSALVGTNYIKGHKTISSSGSSTTTFIIGNVSTKQSTQGKKYVKVTNLNNLFDVGENTATVALASVFDPDEESDYEDYYANAQYKILSAQSGNFRSATIIDVTNSSEFPFTTGMTELEISKNANNQYSFFDLSSSLYLYKPSGTNNQLKEQAGPLTNYYYWTISLDSTSKKAEIINVGNSDRGRIYCNDTYRVATESTPAYIESSWFGAYASKNAHDGANFYQKPYLFKKVDITMPEKYSNATEVEFEAYSSVNQTIVSFDVLTAPNSVLDPNLLSNYSVFTVIETTSISVNFNFSESKVIYTAFGSDTWVRVNALSDLREGDTVTFAYGADSATVGSYNSSYKEYGIFTTSNTFSADYSKITAINGATSQFTFGITQNGYTFYDKTNTKYVSFSDSNYHLALSESLTTACYWDVEVDDTIYSATIKSKEDNTYFMKYYHSGSNRYFAGYTENASNTYFPSIYKKYQASGGTGNNNVFIADSIGNNYNPALVDVVGSATFTSSDIQITGTISTNNPTVGSADMGNPFYSPSFADNAIVLKVKKTGSRDLGTLVYSFDGSTTSQPAFATGVTSSSNPTATYKTLADAGATDVDADLTAVSYVLNLNSNNIAELSLCAVDSSNNIIIAYDGSGNMAFKKSSYSTQAEAEAAIDYYCVVIGSTNNTVIHITQIDFTFTNIPGNVGDFGKVGYRSAIYDGLVLDEDYITDCTVQDTIINIFYEVSSPSQIVSCSIVYSSGTYTITFTSSVAMTINVFNYDPNHYSLVVNGDPYTGASNEIEIDATP